MRFVATVLNRAVLKDLLIWNFLIDERKLNKNLVYVYLIYNPIILFIGKQSQKKHPKQDMLANQVLLVYHTVNILEAAWPLGCS